MVPHSPDQFIELPSKTGAQTPWFNGRLLTNEIETCFSPVGEGFGWTDQAQHFDGKDACG